MPIITKQNKALLSELVRTDFKLRYQGSILGYAWSLLRPLFLFAILYLVFTRFIPLGKDIPHYPVYLLLGIVMWQFFADMTNQSLGSIVARGDLIRKISIPRWMIVLTSSFSAVINLGLNLIIVAVLMMINQVPLTANIFLLPVFIIEIYLIGLGLSLFLSAVFVKYRDTSFIWEVIMQAGFYLTPIIYPLTVVQNIAMRKLLLLNPIAQAIQDSRHAVITSESITISSEWSENWLYIIPVGIVMIIFVIGVLYFRKKSPTFAEDL